MGLGASPPHVNPVDLCKLLITQPIHVKQPKAWHTQAFVALSCNKAYDRMQGQVPAR
jgi:hypothetical protein